MSTEKLELSPRQESALRVLGALMGDGWVTGPDLAWLMTDAGCDATAPAAHAAASFLVNGNLAFQRHGGGRFRYRITPAGRDWLADHKPEGYAS